MGLVSELRRRNVFRVAIAYLIIAWLILQVGDTLAPALHLAEWVNTALAFFLILGFPIALVFAWAFELTPEGLKKEKDVDRSQSITNITRRKLNYLIIAVLVLVLVFFAFDKFVLDPSRDAELVQTTTEAITERVAESANAKAADKSIAVLAFADLSPEGDQEYFSDGISEELLNLLAQIPELTVISRSSSFSFKGKDIAIPTVAKQLNVAHVLEGSVRKAGNRVRITAQLIEARSDSHLWSETYDRPFDDIFAIQDEIATAVVGQLKVRLLGETPKVHEVNADAYTLFLQGRYLVNQGSVEAYNAATEVLQQALVIDANYPAAWAELGRNYVNQISYLQINRDEYYPKAIEAFDTALTLDPELAEAWGRLAWARQHFESDLATAAELFERGLTLAPGNAYVLGNAASLLRTLGRTGQAIKLEKLALQRDPLNTTVSFNLGWSYLIGWHLDEAEAMYRRTLLLSPDKMGARAMLARILFHQGDLETALLLAEEEPFSLMRLTAQAIIHHALGNLEESKAALDTLIGEYQQVAGAYISLVYVVRGDAERALEWMEKGVETQGPQILATNWMAPEFKVLYSDPRWEELLTRAGVSQQQLAEIQFDMP